MVQLRYLYCVGGLDYVGAIRSLEFSSDGEWDVMITILEDLLLEGSEFFLISLSSDNPSVVFVNTPATVVIVDNDSM